jgi:hypothetical protein
MRKGGCVFQGMSGLSQPKEKRTGADAPLFVAERLEGRLLLSTSDVSTYFNYTPAIGYGPNFGLVADSSGNFYGRGASASSSDIYEIAAGSRAYSVLATFNTSGYSLSNLVMDASGNLFTTTGTQGKPQLIEVAAGSHAETVLHTFSPSYPLVGYDYSGNLTVDPAGNIYGVWNMVPDGFIFEISASTHTYSIVHAFNGTDGSSPSSLVADSAGNIYGTTKGGGPNNGTLFEITAGTHSFSTVVSNFNIGSGPFDLVIDSSGNVYGLLSFGWSDNNGGIFGWDTTSHTLITIGLSSSSYIGEQPSDLTVDSEGNLFGIQSDSGSASIFKIDAATMTQSTLYSFTPPPTSSYNLWPFESAYFLNLIESRGNLFGTAILPGSVTLYELVPGASELAFQNQPSAAIHGKVVAPAITVEAQYGDGAFDDLNNSSVTLSIASGPAGATLGGTLTLQAVNGVATFSDFTLSDAGNYTLAATADGLTATTSASFKVFGDISRLVFIQEPENSFKAGAIPTFKVEDEDQNGDVITADNSTVINLSGSGPAGADLGGTIEATVVQGVATFSNVVPSAPG